MGFGLGLVGVEELSEVVRMLAGRDIVVVGEQQSCIKASNQIFENPP